MGGTCCKPVSEEIVEFGRVKSFKRPRWRSDTPLTEEELQRMRAVFWDTEPHYGGNRGASRGGNSRLPRPNQAETRVLRHTRRGLCPLPAPQSFGTP